MTLVAYYKFCRDRDQLLEDIIIFHFDQGLRDPGNLKCIK